jgi:NitT/TauT family transport system substrate-binding protein
MSHGRLYRATCLWILAFSCLVPSSCAPGSPEKQGNTKATTVLTIAVNPVPQTALVIVAFENHYFREEGIEAHISKFTTGKLAFDAVLGGAADIATVADIPIMYAAMSGQTPAVVATIERSGRSIKLLARKDEGVNTPDDLRGKKIGTFKASSAEFFLDRFLTKHQVSLNQVTVVQLQPTDLVPAILRGDLAAISIWEPNIYVAKRELGARALVFEDPAIYTEIVNMACTEAFFKGHGPEIRAVIRALRKAEAFIKASPKAALSTIATFTAMDQPTLESIWPAFDLTLGLDQGLPALLRSEAEFAVANGTLPSPARYPDFAVYLHRDFLEP